MENVHCYKYGIFPAFHQKGKQKYTKQAILSTAFRAEKYVDKWAEKECKSYFPDFKWIGVYRTKKSREGLTKYYQKYFSSWYETYLRS